MGNKSNQQRRPSRRDKELAAAAVKAAQQGLGGAIKEKPAIMVGKKIDLTESQKTLGNIIKSNDLVFVEGSAGSGKSTGVLAEFVSTYLADNTKKIIVIRTPVEAGSDKIGFLPNGYDEKVAPHFEAAKDTLNMLLGKGKVECDMDHRIFFKIPNYCLGQTFDNALVMIDEAQQLQPMIMKLLLERAGQNTKVVVVGDPSQLYVNDKARNGLTDAMDRFIGQDGEPFYPLVDWFKFPIEDCKTRSDLAFTVVKAYSGIR
jgi:phosphate starvation-inducible PhoH-like protein